MSPKAQLALWIAHPVLELILTAIMLWRRQHRQFPVFFTYIVCQIVVFGVLFPIHQYAGYDLYFYSYWISAAISLALGFKVIHEVFLHVFRPYHTLKDLGSVLFKWAALVMVFVAIVVAAASPPGQSPLAQAVITVQRCVHLIQCGLILFLLVFSRYLGVSWRQHSFGIVLGFGGFASVELAGNALYSGGQVNSRTIAIMNAVAYGLTMLAWIAYSSATSESREATGSLVMSQRWEQSLSDLQHPSGGDSLIPMFEVMVDRAFSRTPEPEKVREVIQVKLPPEKKPATSESAPSDAESRKRTRV